MKKLSMVVLLLSLAGCATAFTGNPKTGGPAACRSICEKWDMELAGMVIMGEYSDGCICKAKGGSTVSLIEMSSASLAPVAGVMMQMKRIEDEERGLAQ